MHDMYVCKDAYSAVVIAACTPQLHASEVEGQIFQSKRRHGRNEYQPCSNIAWLPRTGDLLFYSECKDEERSLVGVRVQDPRPHTQGASR